MRCAECRELLVGLYGRRIDARRAAAVREHLATCADCAREDEAFALTSRRIKESVMRHSTPDVLKARIRVALAQDDAFTPPARTVTGAGPAALAVLAAAGSLSRLRAARSPRPSMQRSAAREHARRRCRRQPHSLVDAGSSHRRRVDEPASSQTVVQWPGQTLSPAVPNLDSADSSARRRARDYVDGRAVPVVTYTRRQHVINVYARPADERSSSARESRNGFHVIKWQSSGSGYWVCPISTAPSSSSSSRCSTAGNDDLPCIFGCSAQK